MVRTNRRNCSADRDFKKPYSGPSYRSNLVAGICIAPHTDDAAGDAHKTGFILMSVFERHIVKSQSPGYTTFLDL